MAGSLTDLAEIDILKLITGQATTIWVTTQLHPYVGLFPLATMPSDSSAGTECVINTGAYARVLSTTMFTVAPSAGSVSNSATITFPTATAAWASGGALGGFGLFSASTAGTLLAWGSLTDQTKTVGTGDTVSFAASALVITCD